MVGGWMKRRTQPKIAAATATAGAADGSAGMALHSHGEGGERGEGGGDPSEEEESHTEEGKAGGDGRGGKGGGGGGGSGTKESALTNANKDAQQPQSVRPSWIYIRRAHVGGLWLVVSCRGFRVGNLSARHVSLPGWQKHLGMRLGVTTWGRGANWYRRRLTKQVLKQAVAMIGSTMRSSLRMGGGGDGRRATASSLLGMGGTDRVVRAQEKTVKEDEEGDEVEGRECDDMGGVAGDVAGGGNGEVRTIAAGGGVGLDPSDDSSNDSVSTVASKGLLTASPKRSFFSRAAAKLTRKKKAGKGKGEGKDDADAAVLLGSRRK